MSVGSILRHSESAVHGIVVRSVHVAASFVIFQIRLEETALSANCRLRVSMHATNTALSLGMRTR
jgi:hypothetical protein